MVYHQINIESYILLSKVHTSELYIGVEKKARKNRNVFPCLLQCALFVILYNLLSYLKILFYTFCQFHIIDELFSNFLLTFTIFFTFSSRGYFHCFFAILSAMILSMMVLLFSLRNSLSAIRLSPGSLLLRFLLCPCHPVRHRSS